VKTTNKLTLWLDFYKEWFNLSIDEKEIKVNGDLKKPQAGSSAILVPANFTFTQLCKRLKETGDFKVLVDRRFKVKNLEKVVKSFFRSNRIEVENSLYYLRFKEMDPFDKLLTQAFHHFQTGQFLSLDHELAGGRERICFGWDTLEISPTLRHEVYLGYTSFSPPQFYLEFWCMDFPELRRLEIDFSL